MADPNIIENEINLGFDNPLSASSNKSDTRKIIIKKYFSWAIINHFVQSFMAIIISLAVSACALYLIVDSYINNVDHPVWADIVMSLLLGVWVSGKPKFFSRKKVDKETEHTK
jgi:hypothetical protein